MVVVRAETSTACTVFPLCGTACGVWLYNYYYYYFPHFLAKSLQPILALAFSYLLYNVYLLHYQSLPYCLLRVDPEATGQKNSVSP
jgi:hypothetical protein